MLSMGKQEEGELTLQSGSLFSFLNGMKNKENQSLFRINAKFYNK
jgi:hypothetical protein